MITEEKIIELFKKSSMSLIKYNESKDKSKSILDLIFLQVTLKTKETIYGIAQGGRGTSTPLDSKFRNFKEYNIDDLKKGNNGFVKNSRLIYLDISNIEDLDIYHLK